VDTEDLERLPVALEFQSILPAAIPDIKCGAVRSAVLNDHRFVCLFVTESNVTSLLYLAGGLSQTPDDSKKAARELFDEISRWDEVLFLPLRISTNSKFYGLERKLHVSQHRGHLSAKGSMLF